MNNLNSVLALQFGFNAMDATKPPYLILHQVSAFQGITKIGSKVPKTYFSDWIFDKKPNQWPFSLFKQWIWCLKRARILNFTSCMYLLEIRNFDKKPVGKNTLSLVYENWLILNINSMALFFWEYYELCEVLVVSSRRWILKYIHVTWSSGNLQNLNGSEFQPSARAWTIWF